MLRLFNLKSHVKSISWKGTMAATLYLIVFFILWGEGGIANSSVNFELAPQSLLHAFGKALKNFDFGDLIIYLVLSIITSIIFSITHGLIPLRLKKVLCGLLGWLIGSIVMLTIWHIIAMAPIQSYLLITLAAGGHGFLVGYFSPKATSAG